MIRRFVVLGATGDLASRYLLPALARLHETGKLPDELTIVGAAQQDWDTAALRAHMMERLARHAAGTAPVSRHAVLSRLVYQRADVFFFLVGLEIKREILRGELASARKTALPVVAALGGVVAPAAIYSVLNVGGPGARGSGIPMATDIAFALGASRCWVAALLRRCASSSPRSRMPLQIAAALLLVLIVVNRTGIAHVAPYLLLGVALWIAVLKSGVHPTIAGGSNREIVFCEFKWYSGIAYAVSYGTTPQPARPRYRDRAAPSRFRRRIRGAMILSLPQFGNCLESDDLGQSVLDRTLVSRVAIPARANRTVASHLFRPPHSQLSRGWRTRHLVWAAHHDCRAAASTTPWSTRSPTTPTPLRRSISGSRRTKSNASRVQ